MQPSKWACFHSARIPGASSESLVCVKNPLLLRLLPMRSGLRGTFAVPPTGLSHLCARSHPEQRPVTQSRSVPMVPFVYLQGFCASPRDSGKRLACVVAHISMQ